MFGIGAPELFGLLLLGVLLFGTRRLSSVAKDVGRVLFQIKKSSDEAVQEIKKHLHDDSF